ncbi:MAG: DUF1861 family protein [Oscillospiraceae bacterium]|nr:DUF1861 family protein [Oscillospiraceae bacterium]
MSGNKPSRLIHMLQLPDGIAVFSRPRDETVRQTFGSHAVIGFTKIANLEELTADIIANADIITDVFGQDEWGGCNQCYYLDSGLIGIIGHKSYSSSEDAETADLVYVNVAWIFDPDKHKMLDERILAVRSSYPDATPKRSRLADCAFTSGISPAEGDQVWLYSGLGDAREGRILIPDPFKAFGKVTKWV